jgi:hypothetical protein
LKGCDLTVAAFMSQKYEGASRKLQLTPGGATALYTSSQHQLISS